MCNKTILFLILFGFLIVSGCTSSSQYQSDSIRISPSQTVSSFLSNQTTQTITFQSTTIIVTPTKTLAQLLTKNTPEVSGVCDCSYNRYNCPDFSTHTAAQACYNYCIAQGKGDIHRLDANKDGQACETN